MAAPRDRDLDIVVWGATGFTGRLVCEYLATHHAPGTNDGLAGSDDPARGLAWGIGGRNSAKLQAVLDSLPGSPSVPIVVADAYDPESLAALAERTRCVASTAGPFARVGSPLVAACVAAGTHYADITGESPWVADMIEAHHTDAIANETLIVSCCGYDSIPSDLGAHFLARHVQDAHGEDASVITCGASMSGGISGGTLASAMNLIDTYGVESFNDAFLLNPAEAHPRLEDRGPLAAFEADRKGVSYDNDLAAWTSPFVMAGVNTRVVRRSAALFELAPELKAYATPFRYNEAMRFRTMMPAAIATVGLAVFGMLMYFKLTRWFLNKFLPQPGQGPSPEQRASGRFSHTMATRLADGTLVKSRVAGGDPGYGETAKFLSESAIVLSRYSASLPVKGGCVTPAFAMGDVLTQRLKDAGITFEIIE